MTVAIINRQYYINGKLTSPEAFRLAVAAIAVERMRLLTAKG